MEIKKFRPGQLICRMSKRSVFNQYIAAIFGKELKSGFTDEMEKEIYD